MGWVKLSIYCPAILRCIAITTMKFRKKSAIVLAKRVFGEAAAARESGNCFRPLLRTCRGIGSARCSKPPAGTQVILRSFGLPIKRELICVSRTHGQIWCRSSCGQGKDHNFPEHAARTPVTCWMLSPASRPFPAWRSACHSRVGWRLFILVITAQNARFARKITFIRDGLQNFVRQIACTLSGNWFEYLSKFVEGLLYVNQCKLIGL